MEELTTESLAFQGWDGDLGFACIRYCGEEPAWGGSSEEPAGAEAPRP